MVLAVTIAGSALRRPIGSRLSLLAAILSVIPDADVIGFSFGIQYGDLVGP